MGKSVNDFSNSTDPVCCIQVGWEAPSLSYKDCWNKARYSKTLKQTIQAWQEELTFRNQKESWNVSSEAKCGTEMLKYRRAGAEVEHRVNILYRISVGKGHEQGYIIVG